MRLSLQGARNKSNTHFAAVYPPDTTNNSLPLLKSEAIWWRENALGNSVTNKDEAEKVVRSFMEALETTFPQYVLRNNLHSKCVLTCFQFAFAVV